MKKGIKLTIALSCVILLGGIGTLIFFYGTPKGQELITAYRYDVGRATEDSYANRKKVEDTCRAYIASYNADKLGYEQYKDSEDVYYKNLAQSYRQRANQTAVTYNEYFLKNSYVWKDNIPSDIVSRLEII